MRIIAVSDSFSHFEKAVAEYQKRLGDSVQTVIIKPEKLAEPSIIPRKETERVIEYLKKEKLKVILMDEFGKKFSTLELASMLRGKLDQAEDVVFLIGGAFGVERELIAPYVAGTFSLGALTLPHSLAYLTLLEQVYRCKEIWKGSKYHHGANF